MRNTIAEELFSSLKEYQNQEQIFVVAALEVLGLVGPCQSSLDRLQTIKNILVDPDL